MNLGLGNKPNQERVTHRADNVMRTKCWIIRPQRLREEEKKCLLLHSSAPRVDYTGTIAQKNKAELSPLIYFKTSDQNHRVQKLG